MSRRRIALLAAAAAVAVAVGLSLWALPELVRRTAVDRIAQTTGRATHIGRVRLNLLTGSFAVERFRLAERTGSDEFIELAGLEGRLSLPWLARRDVRIRSLVLRDPTVRIVRRGPGEFNFSDLLALIPPPDPTRKPSGWSVTVDRFRLERGRIIIRDLAVAPAADWPVGDLDIDASGITTGADRPPGRASVAARIGSAHLAVDAAPVRLTPDPASVLSVALRGFDLGALRPYLPADAAVVPDRGQLGTDLRVELSAPAGHAPQAVLSGEITAEDLSLTRQTPPARVAALPRASVRIARADWRARRVVVASVDLEGADLHLTRFRDGRVDLFAGSAESAGSGEAPALSAPRAESTPVPPAPPAAASGPAVPSAAKPWTVVLERLSLKAGTFVYRDETLTPARETILRPLAIEGAGLSTSPADPPGRLTVKSEVGTKPGTSPPFTLSVDADALRLEPLLATGAVEITGFDLPALAPILAQDFPIVPAAGRLDLSIRLDAEEAAESTRNLWVSGTIRVTDAALVRRGASRPFARLPRIAVAIRRGNLLTQALDLESLELEGAEVRAVRDAQGRVDLLALASSAPAARASPASTTPAPPSPGASRTQRPINDAIAAAISRPWSVSLDRLSLRRTSATLDDQAVTPPQEMRLRSVGLEGRGLSTAPRAAPGRLSLRGQLLVGVDPRPAAIAVDARSLALVPFRASASLSLKDFGLAWPAAYLPASAPAQASDGRLAADLSASVAEGKAGLSQAVASGTLQLTDAAAMQRGASEPFLTLPSVTAVVSQADAVHRAIHVASIEIEEMKARGIRYPDGRVDLLGLVASTPPAPPGGAPAPVSTAPPDAARSGLRPGAAAAAPTPVGGPPGGPPAWTARLDRFQLRRGTATFEDRFVQPTTTLPATDLDISAEDITWPVAGPATVRGSARGPEGGRVEIQIQGLLDPLKIQVKIDSRDLSIAPFDAYFPFPARFRGLFSDDSVSEIEYSQGTWRVAARGTAWAREIQVWEPGRDAPDITTERMEIRGIDFSWPTHALVDRVLLTAPSVHIERDAEGVFNLRRMFEVHKRPPGGEGSGTLAGPDARAGDRPDGRRQEGSAEEGGGAQAPETPAVPAATKPEDKGGEKSDAQRTGSAGSRGAGEVETPSDMPVVSFNEIVLDGASVRFVDRTTKPAFSQEMSSLVLRIGGLSNVLGRERTTLRATALVGGDGGLDLRGEMSGIGETLRADLVGELRNYPLASANPYADSETSWIVERGKLAAKLHYRVEGDVITAENEINFGGLEVRRSKESDEIKRRIGLPLGLIVGLMKDTRGNIDFALPLKGSLKSGAMDWSDTVWSGVKQAVLKILAGPFRAIGRAFRGGSGSEEVPDLSVDPLVFAAGSAVIAPEMEAHLTKVADFLRRSPYVKLTLHSVVTASDVESLKSQALTARIQRVQHEGKLEDFGAAVTAYYKAQRLGGDIPPTPDAQLAALQKREPVPEAGAHDLAGRRLAAARDELTRAEGIPAERLMATEPEGPVAESGSGRVEFSIGE